MIVCTRHCLSGRLLVVPHSMNIIRQARTAFDVTGVKSADNHPVSESPKQMQRTRRPSRKFTLEISHDLADENRCCSCSARL